MGKILGWVGGVVTTLWVGLLAAYAVFKWETIVDLEPNEVGDLLGGSMGPLALFWLVLGYLQQGIELRQNGAALNLQAEELKHAVDQYKEMARVANEQLIHDKEVLRLEFEAKSELRRREKAAMQPNFNFYDIGGRHSDTSTFELTLVNAGGSATDVTLNFSDGTTLSRPKVAHWPRDHVNGLRFVTPRQAHLPTKELTISYRDVDGDRASVTYVAEFRKGEGDFSLPVFYKKRQLEAE